MPTIVARPHHRSSLALQRIDHCHTTCISGFWLYGRRHPEASDIDPYRSNSGWRSQHHDRVSPSLVGWDFSTPLKTPVRRLERRSLYCSWTVAQDRTSAEPAGISRQEGGGPGSCHNWRPSEPAISSLGISRQLKTSFSADGRTMPFRQD